MIQEIWDANRVRVGAIATYVWRRSGRDAAFLRSMIAPARTGRSQLLPDERRDAMRADATLRRLGVRCLWRAAIVTEQLRRRGVAANVGLTVSSSDPRRAHAECEVGGEPLRSYGDDSVRLR